MNKNLIATITGILAVAFIGYSLTTYQLPPHVPATGRLLGGNIIKLETSGNENEWKLYDLRGTTYNGVQNCASYAIIMADVSNSVSHGIRIGEASSTGCKPSHVIVINSSVINSVLQNYPPSPSNSWGSCIKVEIGVSYVEIRNNVVENCYGEGIDAAEALFVNVIGNTLTNCWSYCIYIDNSADILVQNNTAACPDTSFNRSGSPAVGFGVGDENLSKWGGGGVSIAARITIAENTSYKCQAARYWGSQYTNGGVDTLAITNNVAYDTSTRVNVASKPRNKNIVVSGNTYLSSGQTPKPSPETTKTNTPSPTLTLTRIVATQTPSLTPTSTFIPTATLACTSGYTTVNTSVQINTYPKSINIRNDHNSGAKPVGNLYADPGIRHAIVGVWTDCVDYWAALNDGHWFALRVNGVWYSDWRP